MKRLRRLCGMIAGLSLVVLTFGCESLPFWTLLVLLIIFGAAMYFGGFMYGLFYPATYGHHYRQAKRKVTPTAATVRVTRNEI